MTAELSFIRCAENRMEDIFSTNESVKLLSQFYNNENAPELILMSLILGQFHRLKQSA